VVLKFGDLFNRMVIYGFKDKLHFIFILIKCQREGENSPRHSGSRSSSVHYGPEGIQLMARIYLKKS
jgi:hypothetical protein